MPHNLSSAHPLGRDRKQHLEVSVDSLFLITHQKEAILPRNCLFKVFLLFLWLHKNLTNKERHFHLAALENDWICLCNFGTLLSICQAITEHSEIKSVYKK